MRSAYSDKSGCSIASGGSSIGASSTATLSGNEFQSLTVSDDFPSDHLHIEFSTNYGKCHLILFIKKRRMPKEIDRIVQSVRVCVTNDKAKNTNICVFYFCFYFLFSFFVLNHVTFVCALFTSIYFF